MSELILFEFSENNSGGSWWLERKDYEAMFAAGWYYEASEIDIREGHDKNPWIGRGDAPYGWRHGVKGKFVSARDAVESFERATGRNFFETGCPCCGCPYSLSWPGGNISGDSVEREVIRPW